jgi:hypothetical protein
MLNFVESQVNRLEMIKVRKGVGFDLRDLVAIEEYMNKTFGKGLWTESSHPVVTRLQNLKPEIFQTVKVAQVGDHVVADVQPKKSKWKNTFKTREKKVLYENMTNIVKVQSFKIILILRRLM